MRLWELFRLALGGVRRTPLRVTLTALGVAIATGALVSMVGFALGIQTRAEEPFQRLELLNRIDVLPNATAPALGAQWLFLLLAPGPLLGLLATRPLLSRRNPA